ncbi:MAG: hypothetical protein HN849_34625 [Victivallales bacterium]|nr:hypothetical protein [Victivallales bacterium]
MHSPDAQKSQLRFRTGLVTIVTSFVVGYGGLAVFAALAAYHKNKDWLWGGAACYAFSWVMLLFGIWLGGRPAYEYTKQFWHLWKRRRRLLHLRRTRAKRRSLVEN